MKFAKISVFVMLICIPCMSLSATKYKVFTKNKKIECTLNTLSKQQMNNMAGSFAPFMVPVVQTDTSSSAYSWDGDHISQSSTTVVSKKVDPFGDAAKNLMAVQVTIKNNSSNMLSLTNGQYIRGVENALVPKEELIRTLYPDLNNHLWGELIDGGITSISGAVFTALATGITLDTIFNPNPIVTRLNLSWHFRSRHIHASGKRPLTKGEGITFGTLLTLCGVVVTIGGACIAYKAGKDLNVSHEKEKNLKNSSFYERLKRYDQRVVFASNDTYFDIPPHSEFHDVFFVNLDEARGRREVFKKIKPVLMYDEDEE